MLFCFFPFRLRRIIYAVLVIVRMGHPVVLGSLLLVLELIVMRSGVLRVVLVLLFLSLVFMRQARRTENVTWTRGQVLVVLTIQNLVKVGMLIIRRLINLNVMRAAVSVVLFVAAGGYISVKLRLKVLAEHVSVGCANP